MRSIRVITSQHKPYYDSIGKDSIESFLEKWPKDIKLELYAEEFIPDIADKRLIVNPMLPVLKKWHDYINLRETKKKTKMAKFWLKSFVVIDAIKNTNEDILIWLDSDVITHKEITKEFLYSLLPEDTLLCDIPALGSLKDKESETGFCMLNMKHPMLDKFLKEYESYYKTKDGLASLPRDIDSSVWWAARKTLVEQDVKVNGLYSSINSHVPFMGTCLKEYMRHWVTKANKVAFKNNDRTVTFEEDGLHGITNKDGIIKQLIPVDQIIPLR
jgi:hypothetical protein